MGLEVGGAPEDRSGTRVYLGLVVEMASTNARASLLALTPPAGMRALPDPPQHTQRQDPALTSTCRRSWSARPARDVGCSCTSKAACALRGTQVAVMSGTKAQQAREVMAGVCPVRAEQRKPPGATSAAAGRSLTSALLAVPSTAGSQQRRPNARCAAVGEASEASRDADVTVAHAHAQRHGCLSARWPQTRHAC